MPWFHSRMISYITVSEEPKCKYCTLLGHDTVQFGSQVPTCRKNLMLLFSARIIFYGTWGDRFLRNVGTVLRICTVSHRRRDTLQNDCTQNLKHGINSHFHYFKAINTSRCPSLQELRYATVINCKPPWATRFMGQSCVVWINFHVTCLAVYLIMICYITH
jgi:hypothetical protein